LKLPPGMATRSFGSGSAIFLLGGLAEAAGASEAEDALDARGGSDRSLLGVRHPLSARNTSKGGTHDLWTRSTARASPGARPTSKTQASPHFARYSGPSEICYTSPVPIETLSLTVPAEQRADFLARAARLVQRADSSRASRTELELALAVLSVLCGAASEAGETAPGAER
jgi:hypothetical protein